MPIFQTFDSRYRLTPVVKFNDSEMYGKWVKFGSIDSASYSNYVVAPEFDGRADLISYAMYDTPSYYWILIAYNNPYDPLNWPKTGETIKIPNITQILAGV